MKAIQLTETLYDYLIDVSLRETDVQRRLRAYTSTLERARMQIAPEQASSWWLVRLTGARRIVEVGTFTGYSALAMALALPPDDRLIACDIDGAYRDRAAVLAGGRRRRSHRAAPRSGTRHTRRADHRVRPQQIDLAFIDADKTAHLFYYERRWKCCAPAA